MFIDFHFSLETISIEKCGIPGELMHALVVPIYVEPH